MAFARNKKKRLVLFASGNGTNVERILNYFKNNKINCIISNKIEFN